MNRDDCSPLAEIPCANVRLGDVLTRLSDKLRKRYKRIVGVANFARYEGAEGLLLIHCLGRDGRTILATVSTNNLGTRVYDREDDARPLIGFFSNRVKLRRSLEVRTANDSLRVVEMTMTYDRVELVDSSGKRVVFDGPFGAGADRFAVDAIRRISRQYLLEFFTAAYSNCSPLDVATIRRLDPEMFRERLGDNSLEREHDAIVRALIARCHDSSSSSSSPVVEQEPVRRLRVEVREWMEKHLLPADDPAAIVGLRELCRPYDARRYSPRCVRSEVTRALRQAGIVLVSKHQYKAGNGSYTCRRNVILRHRLV